MPTYFQQDTSSQPATRPVTATGSGHVHHELDGDFYIKYKKLQKQLEFLQVFGHGYNF